MQCRDRTRTIEREEGSWEVFQELQWKIPRHGIRKGVHFYPVLVFYKKNEFKILYFDFVIFVPWLNSCDISLINEMAIIHSEPIMWNWKLKCYKRQKNRNIDSSGKLESLFCPTFLSLVVLVDINHNFTNICCIRGSLPKAYYIFRMGTCFAP